MAGGRFGRGRLAFVIDDDATVRLLARESLESWGFEVREASDGETGLATMQECEPDIILLDVLMPGLDGYAVCSKVRRLRGLESVPILMLTGLGDVESINRAYEVGATDFISKPVNWNLLGHRMRYITRASRAFRGLAKAQRIARLANWEWSIGEDAIRCSDELYHLFDLIKGERRCSYDRFLERIDRRERQRVHETRIRSLQAGEPYSVSYRLSSTENGTRFIFERAEVIPRRHNASARLVGTIQDVTERKKSQERIQFLAFHDSLTRLPNRARFKEVLDSTLVRARRHEQGVALLFLDLDRFKRVNDTFGHSVGDEVLVAVAKRISECVRRRDTVHLNDAVARVGGDEFIVLLDEVEGELEASRVARRILDALGRPFKIEGDQIVITPSIGITMCPKDGWDPETLLKNADIAMYLAKQDGRNGFKFHTDQLNRRVLRVFSLEKELRSCVERNELRVHYQPVIDVATGGVVSVEALLRWNSRRFGSVSPTEFIPVAEDTGLIEPIGEWLLKEVYAQQKRWRGTEMEGLRTAVNVSGRQLGSRRFLRAVSDLIEQGLEPSCLELELTESTLMNDTEASARTLKALKALGLTLTIDDFGTGYSSFAYLKRFPLDYLKVDRSFVKDLGSDDGASIVAAIIAMAHSLQLKVVAEGVETQAQLSFLAAQHCDAFQGFLVARPGPPESIEALCKGSALGGLPALSPIDPEGRRRDQM